MKTGAELKARRLELKITQQDLADKIGVSRTQLSRMENGKIEIPIEIRPILYDSLYTKNEHSKLQFSDLEVGDYVYVRDDLIEYYEYGSNSYVDGIGNGYGCITDIVNDQLEINNCGYYATPEMLDLSRSMKKEDYLKVNEKEDVSFDDLIDAAVQAKKEGIINHLIIGNSMIDFNYDSDDKNNHFDEEEVKEGIEFIQSLYTEEFVIECEDDIKRIKVNAEIEFKNGNKDIVDGIINDGKEIQISEKNQYGALGIFILKGATVKQSKGVK